MYHFGQNSNGRISFYTPTNNRNISKKTIDYEADYNRTMESTLNLYKYFDGTHGDALITDLNNNITDNFRNSLNDCINSLNKMIDNEYFKFMFKNNLV